MSASATITEREIARVLHQLGTKSMTRSQAAMAARLLGVHWTTVYRLRQRFLRATSPLLQQHRRPNGR